MFKKRLQVKKVRRYPCPAYPVLEAGEALFLPRERRLGQLARDLARPVMPLVLSTAILSPRAEAAVERSPAGVRAVLLEGRGEPVRPVGIAQDRKAASESPYQIRKFSENEIKELLKELGKGMQTGAFEMGDVEAEPIVLSEAQGRQVLDRFFAKNGLRFRHDVDFSREGVDFKIDGYDAGKKVGYEFCPVSGEGDLSTEEMTRIEKGLKGEHVLLVRDTRKDFDTRKVVLRLQSTAERFLDHLYRTGAIGRGKEILQHIKDLTSGDEKSLADAAKALREIGGEAVWFLRGAARRLEEMEPYAVDRERMEAQRARLHKVIEEIYERKIEPLLEQLDDPALEKREEAADLLLEMGPGIRPYVRDWMEKARKESDREVVQWCEKILKAFGD